MIGVLRELDISMLLAAVDDDDGQKISFSITGRVGAVDQLRKFHSIQGLNFSDFTLSVAKISDFLPNSRHRSCSSKKLISNSILK